MKKNKFQGVLRSKKKESGDVITLKFKLKKTDKFSFTPGQYVILHIKSKLGLEGKPYTISSTPKEKYLSATIKRTGKFSTALHNLKIGEKVIIEGPFGYFYPEEKADNLVFLAAGMGVMPFYGIIKHYLKDGLLNNKKIDLFYSNKTINDIIFFDDLTKISRQNKNLRVFYYITRQKIKNKSIRNFERINIKNVKKEINSLKNRIYFMCGPINFVLDMRKMLLKNGVKEDDIYTESFY